MEFKLYNYFRSSASYRVRIALNLKNIAFEYIPVHLLKNGGEQRLPEFLRKNPMGQVPCLEHRGRFLSQSMAMMIYLDQIQPEPKLFPQEPFLRAKVFEICEAINSGIQPLQNTAVAAELTRQFKADDQQKTQWNKYWIHKGLVALEENLSREQGPYSFGSNVTAADLFLVPQLFAARRFVGPTETFTRLTAIEAECMKLEAFRRAEPSVQPDANA